MMQVSSPELGSTTGGSFAQKGCTLILVAAALFEPGTAGAVAAALPVSYELGTTGFVGPTNADYRDLVCAYVPVQEADATGSDALSEREPTYRNPVSELRHLSGLTWDQLARICGVSRRTLHFWASDKAISAAHEEHLNRLLGVVKRISRGSSQITRQLLLGAMPSGELIVDLLQQGRFEHVVEALGEKTIEMRRPGTSLSVAAKLARRPAPPQQTIDIDQRALKHEIGPTRGVRAVRIRRGET